MVIAVDIGGTKTLVAAVNQNNEILNQVKLPTPQNYDDFIKELSSNIKTVSSETPKIIAMAVPGLLDRENGIVKILGNLPWINKPIVADIVKSTGINNVIIENDANLAGLYEANNLENINQRVMYITFSTGIGTGFVINGELVKELLNAEGGHMVFEHNGKMIDWEELASGKAIVEKYGKRASDLDDPVAWREIAKCMAAGIVDNLAIFMADTVIIGGGVGTHFNKFGVMLNEEVENLLQILAMIPKPIIVGAKHAEEAVVLGAVILAHQHEQHS